MLPHRLQFFWSTVFELEIFEKYQQNFYPPLREGVVLTLTNLNPPINYSLTHVWMKVAQWFSRRSRKSKKKPEIPTDGGPKIIRKSHLIFQLRCAKNRCSQLDTKHQNL